MILSFFYSLSERFRLSRGARKEAEGRNDTRT